MQSQTEDLQAGESFPRQFPHSIALNQLRKRTVQSRINPEVMPKPASFRAPGVALRLVCAGGLLACLGVAQTTPASPARADWRRVGTLTVADGLPSPSAGGTVERVAFLGDGRLQVALPDGRIWQTADGEQWTRAEAWPAAERVPPAAHLPETGSLVRETKRGPAVLFAGGKQLYRSDDGGRSWRNLTQTRAAAHANSVLGAPVNDLALDPENPDRVAVATATGVWLSMDGGLSWQGWNENLPSFRATRILSAPARGRGMRVLVRRGKDPAVVEWAPGFRTGWLPAGERDPDEALRSLLTASLPVKPSAAVESQGAFYAGSDDGRLWANLDGAALWRQGVTPAGTGAVRRIVTDPQDTRFALAALAPANPAPGKGPRVLRTLDGGATWDDVTSDLPDGPVSGLAFDRATGAVYAATNQGVFLSFQGLRAPEPAAHWTPMKGLPEAPVTDIRLDDAGVRVLAAVDGFGVYETPAPHRTRQPVLLRAADYGAGPAAPGALLTIVGSPVERVTVNSQPGVVLSSNPGESQIQIPFEASGDSLRVTASRNGAEPLSFGMPLKSTAPAILTDGDGFPVVIDADSGLQVDALNPVRPGARLQVLATGLGRVRPDWPAGMAAPAVHPPEVVAGVRVLMDGAPVKVVRAVLAPGYVGFYLVEFDAPEFLDAGAAELMIEGAGQSSNAVRVYTAAQ
jgi:uncharacterized protein (TIGR03437 family)